MLGRQLFLIFLIGIIRVLSTSGVHSMDRSSVTSSWNVSSPLSSVQNISNETFLNNSTHVNNMTEFSTEKLDMKHLDKTVANESSTKKIFETSSRNTEEFSVTEPNVNSPKTNTNSSHFRNIILILVDTVKQEREEFWKKFEKTHSFPVHSYLQVDNHDENGPMKVDLKKYFSPGRKEDEGECKETLRSNISELLNWAHEVKEMTTNVLSAVNFSIPATPTIEETFETVKSNESSESSTKGTIRKRQLQQNDSTRFMDLYERNNSDSPIIMASSSKKESYDDMWDVIDMFTKIRIAFFRAMFDTLSGSSNETMNDELSFQEPQRLRTGFINLVDDALKNLETVSGDKGYVLVLAVPENELDSLIDLLDQQISLSDTLLIVTELCSKNTKRVSFFTKGPAASVFHHTHAIGELVDAIKSIVSQACQERIYNQIQQHQSYEVPIKVMHDTIDFQDMTTVNKSTENKVDIVANRIHDHLTGRMDTSSSSNVVSDTITMFLGMATTLIALITVNSS